MRAVGRTDASAWHFWEHGITVVPARVRGKSPAISWRRYQTDPVTEADMHLWTTSPRFRDCNWCVITGRELICVDADSADAITWVREHLPYTPLRTRTSRGCHFYYRVNPASPVKNQANPDCKLDVRGIGGCAVLPGSVHESGAVYELERDVGVDPFDDIPMWQASYMRLIEDEVAAHDIVLGFTPRGWHDQMISEVASKVTSDDPFTDEEILAEAPGWTQPGYTEEETLAEFQTAIDGARNKWGPTNEAVLARRKADDAARAEAQQEAVQAKIDALEPTPFEWTDGSDIEAREWVYGTHYIRRYLSLTVAAGGTGKTALTTCEAVAMASGKPLLGVEVDEPRRVWVWGLEDPIEEAQRRIAAICQHYHISADDLGGRLYVNSGRDSELVIAETQNGDVFLTPAVDAVIQFIREYKIDAVCVDPFVSSHRAGSENDNAAIDVVAKAWARIADAAGCAVHLVHHVRKASPHQSESYSDARGASSLTDAARHVRRLQKMSDDESRMAGIDEPWRYTREGTSKDNLAPPSSDSSWRKMVSVLLPNGDSVGVVEPWSWPDPFADITTRDLDAVLAKIRSGQWREDVRSSNWAGIAVAEVLELDATDPAVKSKIKALLSTWIANRALVIRDGLDSKSMARRFVEVPPK